MRVQFTKRFVATLKPQGRPFELRDAQVRGLVLRVQRSEHKSWIVTWANGKRRTLGSAGHLALDDAREIASKVIAEFIQTGLPSIAKPDLPKITLGAFLREHYAPWARTELKGAESYLERIERVFASVLPRALVTVDSASVERWWTGRLKESTPGGGTIKKATAWRDLATLRSVLSKAVKWGQLDANPLLKLQVKAAQPRTVVRFLSGAEEQRLRKALADRDASAIAARASANSWRQARKRPFLPAIEPGA